MTQHQTAWPCHWGIHQAQDYNMALEHCVPLYADGCLCTVWILLFVSLRRFCIWSLLRPVNTCISTRTYTESKKDKCLQPDKLSLDIASICLGDTASPHDLLFRLCKPGEYWYLTWINWVYMRLRLQRYNSCELKPLWSIGTTQSKVSLMLTTSNMWLTLTGRLTTTIVVCASSHWYGRLSWVYSSPCFSESSCKLITECG